MTMTAASVLPLIMAGLVFGVGILHLAVYLRSLHRPEHLAFAASCFSLFLYDLFCAGLYSAPDPQTGVRWQQMQLISLSLHSIALAWFAFFYTGHLTRRFVFTATTIFACFAGLYLWAPRAWVWLLHEPQVRRFRLPLVPESLFYEMTAGPVVNIQGLLGFVFFLGVLWAVVQQYRAGERERAAPLLLGLGFYFVGVVNDILISAGVIHSVYLIEYAFLGMVLVMTDRLSKEVIDAGTVQETLEQREREYHHILENMNDGLVVHRLDGAILETNDNFCSMTGYTRAELLKMNLRDLGRSARIDVIITLLQEQQAVVFEGTLQCKGGGQRPVNVSARLVPADHGAVVQSFIRDLSELQEARDSIEQSESRLRAFVNAAPVGIGLVFPPERIIGWVNDKLVSLTGYTAEELEGMPARDLYASEDEFERVGRIKHGEVRRVGWGAVETRWQRKDGRVIDILLSSAAIEPGNMDAGLVFTALDITDHKTLEDRVRQAEKMEAIGQLAGGIAHDFNNLIGGIMGYAEILQRKTGGDPSVQRYADQIFTTAERAAHLTESLLTFSRKSSRKNVTVHLHQVVKEAVALLQRTLDPRIEVITVLRADDPYVRGDPTQLLNVLMNLAVNARDAMPEGGRLVFTTARVDLDAVFCRQRGDLLQPGSHLVVEVTDTGMGMDAETAARAFEPFFTTKETNKGTGLGLATVYGTVRDHRGAIRIDSTPGEGTRVRIFLPVHARDETDDGTEDVEEIVRGTGCILLAEDETVVRELGEELLREMGYTVLVAEDGEEAVAVFRERHGEIDLVLLDLVMPKMGGRDALKAMQAIAPHVRVIACSGFSLDADREGLKTLGVQYFIRKPFRAAALSRLIAEALGHA